MKKFFLLFLSILVVVIAVAAVSFLLWKSNSEAPIPGSDRQVSFTIAKNQSAAQTIKNLKSEQIIKSDLVARVYLRVTGLDKRIKPGAYLVSSGQSLTEVVAVLIAGPKDIWVTIPEGWRREQAAGKLVELIPGFDTADFLTKTAPLEGQLFPDTYLIPTDATVDAVLTIFQKNFAKKSGLTLPADRDILIIASMIEREAREGTDRPKVASVLYNRLDIGMALQIDATVQYAKDSQNCQLSIVNCQFWKPIFDTKFPSQYNTYLRPGLPPGPIASPGLASIQAALVPDQTDFLYYLTGNDGVTYFARTLSEHNSNVQKYLKN